MTHARVFRKLCGGGRYVDVACLGALMMSFTFKSIGACVVAGVLVVACTSTPKEAGAVSGYDHQNRHRTAPLLPPGTMCTEIYTEGERYAAACQKAGFTSYRIQCHEYLCSAKLGK